jgi:hypothetical protein
MYESSIPRGLRTAFIIHFLMDILFAIPMMVAPIATLSLFGWQQVDPIATRVVAAALFGIGIQSFLGRDHGREAYMGMLNLKIIWSFATIVGASISLLQGAQGSPLLGWVLVAIFVVFNAVWVYWRIRLSRT